MSFFHIIPPPKKKKHQGRPTTQQATIMTNQMQRVIETFVNKYNESGYFKVNNQSVIQNVGVIIIPFMTNILNKYSEHDFHNFMNKSYIDENGRLCKGFDFLSDWRDNHRFAWAIAMGIASSYKRKLKFDVNVATELVHDIMNSWGWTLYDSEAIGVRHMLFRINRLIQNA